MGSILSYVFKLHHEWGTAKIIGRFVYPYVKESYDQGTPKRVPWMTTALGQMH